GVVRLDVYLDRSVPVAGIVRYGEGAAQPVHAVPATRSQRAEQDKRDKECKQRTAPPPTGPAAPGLRGASPTASPTMSSPLVVVVERDVQLVDHHVRLRWVSSQLCRISTAAA